VFLVWDRLLTLEHILNVHVMYETTLFGWFAVRTAVQNHGVHFSWRPCYGSSWERSGESWIIEWFDIRDCWLSCASGLMNVGEATSTICAFGLRGQPIVQVRNHNFFQSNLLNVTYVFACRWLMHGSATNDVGDYRYASESLAKMIQQSKYLRWCWSKPHLPQQKKTVTPSRNVEHILFPCGTG